MDNKELNVKKETYNGPNKSEVSKRLTFFGEEVVYLVLLGISIAAFGWIIENFVKLITNGFIDSRFHILPFIPPYGLIPFAYQLLIGDVNDLTVFGKKLFKKQSGLTKVISNIIVLTFLCLAVFVSEFTVGNLWEKMFGVALWGYGERSVTFTQYAGLIPSLGYGFVSYAFFKFAYYPLLRAIKKIPFKKAKTIAIVLAILLIADTTVSAVYMIINRKAFMLWKIKFW